MLQDFLGDSKSMKIVYLSVALGIVLVVVGIAVYVLFDKDVTNLIALGLGKLGFDSGTSVYRSVKVDAPVRHLNAQLEIEKAARDEQVPAPMLPNLTSVTTPSRLASDPLEERGT